MSEKLKQIRAVRTIVLRAVLLAVLCAGTLSGLAISTPARAATCVLANGDFEAAQLTPWYVQGNTAAGSSGSLTADAGNASIKSAKVSVNAPGTYEWDVQLVHENVQMVVGKRYTLSFWSKAAAARPASITLQQFDPPFAIMVQQAFTIGTGWQRYDYEFDYPYTAVTTSPSFRVNVGGNATAAWFDSISLCESDTQPPPPTPQPVSANCKVINGDFESGSFNPWSFAATAPAAAALSADAGARSATAAKIAISAAGASADAIALSQGGLALPGGWSSLSFYARSTVGQSIDVAVESNGGVLWQTDARLPDPAVDLAFKHYFFVFQTPASANATLRFKLGRNTGNVWIDAAHVCAAPPKFLDEFSGSALDTGKWTHCVAFSGNCAIDDAYNLVEWYKPANISVSSGTAKLAFIRETGTVCINCSFGAGYSVTRNFAGSYIQTSNSFVTTYGYAEARIKLPRSGGLWPAWWTLPAKSTDGNIFWPPEIDFLEYFSSQPRESVHTLHYNTATQVNTTDGNQYLHPADLSADFHTFSANWTPQEVIWYVDGMEVFRSAAYQVNTPMYFILSVASGNLSGPPAADLSQAVTEVDYVRVFNNGEAFAFDGGVVQPTPTPGPTQAGATSTPQAGATPTARPGATATPRPGASATVAPQPTVTRTPRPPPTTITPGPSPTADPRLTRRTFLPVTLQID